MTSTNVLHLDVWLEGASGRVGLIASPRATGTHTIFTYDPAYLNHPGAVPLSASLPLQRASFGSEQTRSFFDNLLPEGDRRRREALARGLDPVDTVGLLAALGSDCPGAVSVVPKDQPPAKSPGRIESDYEVLSEKTIAGLVSDVAAGRPVGRPLRFSMAGVQRKLALARHPANRAWLLPLSGAPTSTS